MNEQLNFLDNFNKSINIYLAIYEVEIFLLSNVAIMHCSNCNKRITIKKNEIKDVHYKLQKVD